jgi:hypothetical protein
LNITDSNLLKCANGRLRVIGILASLKLLSQVKADCMLKRLTLLALPWKLIAVKLTIISSQLPFTCNTGLGMFTSKIYPSKKSQSYFGQFTHPIIDIGIMDLQVVEHTCFFFKKRWLVLQAILQFKPPG